jgi:hypothetical protein
MHTLDTPPEADALAMSEVVRTIAKKVTAAVL